jgi:hypothetical protein
VHYVLVQKLSELKCFEFAIPARQIRPVKAFISLPTFLVVNRAYFFLEYKCVCIYVYIYLIYMFLCAQLQLQAFHQ